MSSHSPLQRIFPIWGLNPCLLRLLPWQAGSLPPASPGKTKQPINNVIVSGEQRRDSAIHTHGSVLPQRAFPGDADGKESPAMQETCVRSLGQEDPLEKRMATHSSILAWRIPWTEEPGRRQSMGSQSQTRLSDYACTHSLSPKPPSHPGCHITPSRVPCALQ